MFGLRGIGRSGGRIVGGKLADHRSPGAAAGFVAAAGRTCGRAVPPLEVCGSVGSLSALPCGSDWVMMVILVTCFLGGGATTGGGVGGRSGLRLRQDDGFQVERRQVGAE